MLWVTHGDMFFERTKNEVFMYSKRLPWNIEKKKLNAKDKYTYYLFLQRGSDFWVYMVLYSYDKKYWRYAKPKSEASAE